VLYLLGGASRAGKSTLARRLLDTRRVPYFSLDFLTMAFANGWPEFGFDPDASAVTSGEKLWPIVRAMAVNVIEEAATHPSYLIEGDVLLPVHTAELIDAYPGAVTACYIGYTNIDPQVKLADVRRMEGDWMASYADEAILGFIAQAVDFSRYLADECTRYHLPYFDGSGRFAAAIDDAYDFLLRR
jgi:hypothetical protein